MNILILGCGKIGSRHIQSLAGAKHGLTLYVSDTSSDSLDKTQIIFNKVNGKNKDTNLIIVKDIREIKANIEIVIIASNSRERSKLIKSVLDNFKPKHLILEKILFNKIDEYEKFQKIFERINTKVWVNAYMGYEFLFLSKYFNADKRFRMKVSGNWGLCCNSVHFIEIFHHLCNRIPLNIKDFTFIDQYKKSKRDGYYELYGVININSSKSHELSLECCPDQLESVINIELISESFHLKDIWVDEHHNCTIIENGEKIYSERHYNRRQSERTLELVESLLSNDCCRLPTYHQSLHHHLLILDQFKMKFQELGVCVSDGIPIT